MYKLINFDHTPSSNVLQEVHYYIGGGGGPPTCPQASDNVPYFYWSTPQDQVAWLDLIDLITCGWAPHELVTVTILIEDTPIQTEEMGADEQGSVIVEFLVEPENAPGEYRFLFQGRNGELRGKLQVPPPPRPSLYHFFDADKLDTKQLLLYGFKPREEVWIVAYQDSDTSDFFNQYAGMTKVQVGSDGNLFVKSSLMSKDDDGMPVYYAAIGEETGEAESMRRYELFGLFESVDNVYVP